MKKVLIFLGITLIILLVGTSIYVFFKENSRNSLKTITCSKNITDTIMIDSDSNSSEYQSNTKIVMYVKNNAQVVKATVLNTQKYNDYNTYIWMKENMNMPSSNVKYDDNNKTISYEDEIFNNTQNAIFVSIDDFKQSYINNEFICDAEN